MNPSLLRDYRKFLRGLPKYSLSATLSDRTPDRRRENRQTVVIANYTGRMSAFQWWLREQQRARVADMDEGEEDAFEDFEGRHGRVPTFRWSDGVYRYVAQVLNDEDGRENTEGEFTDKEPGWVPHVPWILQKTCPVHGKRLRMGMQGKCDIDGCERELEHAMRRLYPRGPDHRHYWMGGGYHRNEGKSNGREFDYGIVSNYNYFDMRDYYWRDGHTRAEADILAREAFKSRRKRLEEYGKGNLGWVGVVTYLLPLEEDEGEADSNRVLEQDSIWGIESDYETSYIMERALDCGSEAKSRYESSRKQQPSSMPLFGM